MSQFQIGWYIVPEDTEYTKHYEYAAWYTRIMVKAGKYPIYARKYHYHERDKRYTDKVYNLLDIYLNGIVTADDTAGRYFGQYIGTPELNKNVGKQDSMYLSLYGHELGRSVLEDGERYELLPEFQAQEIHFEWNGEPGVSYGVFKCA